MSRTARPWSSVENDWWMVHLGGKKVRLAKGRHAQKDADRRFHSSLASIVRRKPCDETAGCEVA